MEKLAAKGVHKDVWLIVKNLYQELLSKVKWVGECSQIFPVLQGVRQGGILSTSLYKIFIDDLPYILVQTSRLPPRVYVCLCVGWGGAVIYLTGQVVATDDSAAVTTPKLFSSHAGFQTYVMFHSRETIRSKHTVVKQRKGSKHTDSQSLRNVSEYDYEISQTRCRPTHCTARKSDRTLTVTRHQEEIRPNQPVPSSSTR